MPWDTLARSLRTPCPRSFVSEIASVGFVLVSVVCSLSCANSCAKWGVGHIVIILFRTINTRAWVVDVLHMQRAFVPCSSKAQKMTKLKGEALDVDKLHPMLGVPRTIHSH